MAGAEDEEEEEGGEVEESVDAGMASFVSPSKKPVRKGGWGHCGAGAMWNRYRFYDFS